MRVGRRARDQIDQDCDEQQGDREVIDDRMQVKGLQEFNDSVHRYSLNLTGFEYARP